MHAMPLVAAATFTLLSVRTTAQERGAPVPAPAAQVVSADGTKIAYERAGTGPVVILVDGALADRSASARLAKLLAAKVSVIHYDRRGRGQSGDAKQYRVEREVEDIAALIDAAGGSAALFGSSSGAALALEAANALTTKVCAVALFEPPFVVDDTREPIADDFFASMRTLVASDRRGDAVALFMTKAVLVPEAMVGGMKRSPMWRGMEKLAHTLPYDGAILSGLTAGKPLPADRWQLVTARTLVIHGEKSEPWLRNAAQDLARVVPAAKSHTLAGQDHSAAFMAPQAFVPVLVEFFTGPASDDGQPKKASHTHR